MAPSAKMAKEDASKLGSDVAAAAPVDGASIVASSAGLPETAELSVRGFLVVNSSSTRITGKQVPSDTNSADSKTLSVMFDGRADEDGGQMRRRCNITTKKFVKQGVAPKFSILCCECNAMDNKKARLFKGGLVNPQSWQSLSQQERSKFMADHTELSESELCTEMKLRIKLKSEQSQEFSDGAEGQYQPLSFWKDVMKYDAATLKRIEATDQTNIIPV